MATRRQASGPARVLHSTLSMLPRQLSAEQGSRSGLPSSMSSSRSLQGRKKRTGTFAQSAIDHSSVDVVLRILHTATSMSSLTTHCSASCLDVGERHHVHVINDHAHARRVEDSGWGFGLDPNLEDRDFSLEL